MDEFDGWVRHDGEEFLYVLTGVVQLFTEFYEPVEMRRGDSAYYDGSMGHNVISVSDEDATILWGAILIWRIFSYRKLLSRIEDLCPG